ncbi:MAG: tRNA (N(6)-L-threonylcarbamoyladenosine(37)-C(2))-methylthiotransferase [Candidatus Bathyarchaeota archaeon]
MFGNRVYFESYGCPSNRFDIEVMITSLRKLGYITVEHPESADALIINTCGVKKATEDKIISRLCLLKNLEKPIVVTGCLPKIDPSALEKAVPKNLSLIDPFSIDKIGQVLEGIKRDNLNQRFFSNKTPVKVRMENERKGVYEIVPISEGCLGSCTFCCTRFARGRLFSYPLEAIVERIENLVRGGVKEVWLTAQDTGAYGLDKGSNLAQLLLQISKVKGDFYIRVGMMNPNNILGFLEELVEVYQDVKIFKFLHIPVQSGSNKVLKFMNRFYNVSDYVRLVETFRREIPEVSISTDIICGFPGEDEEAFEESLKLIKELKPDIVNVSKFFARPKTVAAKMIQTANQIIKERSKEMASLCKVVSLERNKLWEKWSGEVLIDEVGRGTSVIGRNFAYKPVVVLDGTHLLGKKVKVKVNKVTPTYLIGEVVEEFSTFSSSMYPIK